MADMKETNSTLQRVLSHLTSAPVSEVVETVQKLNAFQALSTLKDGTGSVDLCSKALADGEVAKIDAQALAESPTKLPAKPWTSVAGDGLVSHLVADFFFPSADDPFVTGSTLIDRDLFIQDMTLCNPSQSQFCSRFLVNAICGLRSLSSDKIRLVNEITGTNLTELFVAEAKQHFDTEGGRRCLTTIQALYLFFMVTCYFSTNEAGSVYRLGALDYLSRLDLDKAFAEYRRGNGLADPDQCRALFKTYWGIFNFECILCHAYLRPPPINLLPLAFFPGDTDGSRSTPGKAQIAPRVVPATNRISDMQYRVMKYNSDPIPPVGDESDMRVRNDLLFQLQALKISLIPNPVDSETQDRHTILVKLYINMVACNILRPLRSTTPVYCPDNTSITTTSSSTASIPTPITAKLRLLCLATTDIRLIETYLTRCAPPSYAPSVTVPLWSAVSTILPFLEDEDADRLLATRDAFARGCAMLERLESCFRSMRTFRRGVLAVAWKLGVRIPAPAWPAFEGLEAEVRRGDVDLRNVAVDIVVPLPRDLAERVFVTDSGCAARRVRDAISGLDLAAVLGEWGKALRMEEERLEGDKLERERSERTRPEGQSLEAGRLEEEKRVGSVGSV
ncbi:uncharacterized protein P884DRAFT_275895 [Thermothelomyces heterothallicus CBS 202.75]|uniref:uncharacterized protein n=1 Tax=Thermothelomyces heterothallicus CBS 202.75 TaxID=1149848 RepID=UPI003743A47D